MSHFLPRVRRRRSKGLNHGIPENRKHYRADQELQTAIGPDEKRGKSEENQPQNDRLLVPR
jgi:hypothetical protein